MKLNGGEDGIKDNKKLLEMGGDPLSITVSGFGSGGTMASSLHVIYSDTIKGTGIISGANFPGFLEYYEPYLNPTTEYASGSNRIQDLWYNGWSETEVEAALDKMYVEDLIDNPQNLRDNKVYVSSGEKDLFGTNMNIAAY